MLRQREQLVQCWRFKLKRQTRHSGSRVCTVGSVKDVLAEGIPVARRLGDFLIIQLVDGTFSVSVVGGKRLGRTGSEQDALALAFRHGGDGQVWLIKGSGVVVAVDRPVESSEDAGDT